MSEALTRAVGSYPDRVQGSEYVEAAEEKYKVSYAIGVCNYLRQADPKLFEETFGSMENCVRQAGAFADYAFDTWKIKQPQALALRISAFK